LGTVVQIHFARDKAILRRRLDLTRPGTSRGPPPASSVMDRAMHHGNVDPPGRGLSLGRHRRASACVEFFCCGPGIQTLDDFPVIRHQADEEVDCTEPDLPLKGERRCGVQPSFAGPASWAHRHPRLAYTAGPAPWHRRPLEAPPASRVLTIELRRLSTARSADIAMSGEARTLPNGRQAVQRRKGGSRTLPGPCGGGFGEGTSAPGQVAQIDISRGTNLGPPTHDDGISSTNVPVHENQSA
jgi:hypothetical protein